VAEVEPTKICSRCKEEKPRGEFSIASNAKDGLQRWCMPCMRQVALNNYRKDPERKREYSRKYRADRPEWAKMKNAEYRKLHPEYFKEKKRQYDKERPHLRQAQKRRHHERHAEKIRARVAEWKKKNPHLVVAQIAKRDADQLRATPKWADLTKIAEFYRQAKLLSESGTKYHVDHIVPLRSKLVCGLHVEHNLRVTTAEENLRKRNRLIDECQPLSMGSIGS